MDDFPWLRFVVVFVVFPWLRFVDQIILSHSIFFSMTCTSVTGGIMIKKDSCSGASINDTGNARVRERHECISEASVTVFKYGL